MKEDKSSTVLECVTESNTLPEYSTDGSGAIDIRAHLPEGSITLEPTEEAKISTGLRVNMSEHPEMAAIIIPRSGLGSIHGIVLGNLIGLIDSDYMGEWVISIWNRSRKAYTVQDQDRICQAIFIPIIRPTFIKVDKLTSDTKRGSGGFGHTGK